MNQVKKFMNTRKMIWIGENGNTTSQSFWDIAFPYSDGNRGSLKCIFKKFTGWRAITWAFISRIWEKNKWTQKDYK